MGFCQSFYDYYYYDDNDDDHNYDHDYYFTAAWTVSGSTRLSRYQKGKTRKVKPVWIYWSKR